ncbi:MAG: DUF1614 domain-containing protein [Candidatus Methanoperedens sp.]|nr:DUF1614 domain-containing protein [Candidatus Methanoperedens sp.]
MSRLIYPRLATSFIALLFLMLVGLLFLISLDLIGLAFRKLGFSPIYSVLLLFMSLIGSYINIPVREIASREPLISGYLFTKVDLGDLLLAVIVMTVFIHMLARPVLGLGIAVPALLPPIAAALLAFIISPGQAPIIAYISGTLGSLVGADLLNLDKIPDLRTPVASIGGAGTFDGIFLTGIISVLIA